MADQKESLRSPADRRACRECGQVGGPEEGQGHAPTCKHFGVLGEQGPVRYGEAYRAVVYLKPTDPKRGYFHCVAMGAGLMAMNGERRDFEGETRDQAATRIEAEGWAPFAVEIKFVGHVRPGAAVITVTKEGGR